jgi:HlyD family secretion protein
LSGLESRLVPEQALARKRLLVRQAELELKMQESALMRMRASADLGRRAAAARLESARANAALVEATGPLVALEKAAEAARLRREAALVRAPTAGRVIDIGMRAGEIVGPRPIMRIADVSRMQVIAEVYETDVRSIRIGQPAEARSRAIDGVLKGRVVQVGTLVAPNDVQELGMPATTERRVVDVRIDLDDPALAARLINLQVDVDFLAPEGDGPARGGSVP